MIPSKWQDMFYISYKSGKYCIYFISDDSWANVGRCYAQEQDAKRGAAMLYRHIANSAHKELLGD